MGLTDRVLDLALRDAGGGEVPAGGGASVRRDRQRLYWVEADAPESDAWESVIAIPGSTRLEGAGVTLLASVQGAGSHEVVYVVYYVNAALCNLRTSSLQMLHLWLCEISGFAVKWSVNRTYSSRSCHLISP